MLEDPLDDKRLAWDNKWGSKNFTLDESKMRIKVKEQGVYLIYIQLTYSLKKDEKSTSVDLTLNVEFNYDESQEEFAGAFDTRELREKEEDAHLSTFILLPMKAGNSLSILATPKERIKYNDVRPVSSFISIIRYADLSAWAGRSYQLPMNSYMLYVCQLFLFLLLKSQNWNSSVMMSKWWPVASEASTNWKQKILNNRKKYNDKFGMFA